MKELALAIMFVPLPAFIIAAVIEVRSQRRLIEKLGSLIPIVLGLVRLRFYWARESGS